MFKVIRTNEAPILLKAPFSQAVKSGYFIFVSGQIGINPKNNKLVEGFENQTRQSLDNLFAILKKAGCKAENVVKVTVFLKDMNNYSEFNKIYAQCFTEEFPARSCIEVARLPKDAEIEIEAVAICD
jgi:2-iminobutanoate/2-iminopropanoate deaminase